MSELKDSIREQLECYKSGLLYDEDFGSEDDWNPDWSVPGATGIATERGYLKVAYAHVTDGVCDDITLFGTEYVGHDRDYDDHVDVTEAFYDDNDGGYLRSYGTEEDYESLIDDIADILERNN